MLSHSPPPEMVRHWAEPSDVLQLMPDRPVFLASLIKLPQSALDPFKHSFFPLVFSHWQHRAVAQARPGTTDQPAIAVRQVKVRRTSACERRIMRLRTLLNLDQVLPGSSRQRELLCR